MEAPPIEKAKEEVKEQKLKTKVENILGRKEIKKPGRLREFMGRMIPGQEKDIGNYWQRMADYLEQEDVREALAEGLSPEEIKEKFSIKTEQYEETAFEQTAEAVKETAYEEAEELKKENEEEKERINEMLKKAEIEVDKDIKEAIAEQEEILMKIDEDVELFNSDLEEITEEEAQKLKIEGAQEIMSKEEMEEREKEAQELLSKEEFEQMFSELSETSKEIIKIEKEFNEFLEKEAEKGAADEALKEILDEDKKENEKEFKEMLDELLEISKEVIETQEEFNKFLEKEAEKGETDKALKEILDKNLEDSVDILTEQDEQINEVLETAEKIESVIVDKEYLEEIEKYQEKIKSELEALESAAEKIFKEESEWINKIMEGVSKKNLKKWRIDVETEAKILSLMDNEKDKEDYFEALKKNDHKIVEEYLSKYYDKVEKIAKKKEHPEPEEPTKAKASIRGER